MLEERFHYPLMAEPLGAGSLSFAEWKARAREFSCGGQQGPKGSSISMASFRSHFHQNKGAERQKLCLNTFPRITWNDDGIQLRSEGKLSKALKRLGDLSFIFKHDLIAEVAKPQLVHAG